MAGKRTAHSLINLRAGVRVPDETLEPNTKTALDDHEHRLQSDGATQNRPFDWERIKRDLERESKARSLTGFGDELSYS
jgi:hypothetical protein